MRSARRAANLRRMRKDSPRVEIMIDEFVLHGLAASGRRAIGDGLSNELERLFGETDGLHPFGLSREIRALDAGRISIPADATPALMGARIARAVYSSFRSRGEEKKE